MPVDERLRAGRELTEFTLKDPAGIVFVVLLNRNKLTRSVVTSLALKILLLKVGLAVAKTVTLIGKTHVAEVTFIRLFT